MSTKLQQYKKVKHTGKTTLTFLQWLRPKHFHKHHPREFARTLVSLVKVPHAKHFNT
jgi:hypothetical protein